MNLMQWRSDLRDHVRTAIGSDLSMYADTGNPSIFLTDVPPEVDTPYIEIDDPDVEYQSMTTGYLATIESVIRYYGDRSGTGKMRALTAMRTLAEMLGPGGDPRVVIDGNVLSIVSLEEADTDQPELYNLELTISQITRA